MPNKIKVLESKSKDKGVTVHIFGSVVPEPTLKVVKDKAKVVKIKK